MRPVSDAAETASCRASLALWGAQSKFTWPCDRLREIWIHPGMSSKNPLLICFMYKNCTSQKLLLWNTFILNITRGHYIYIYYIYIYIIYIYITDPKLHALFVLTKSVPQKINEHQPPTIWKNSRVDRPPNLPKLAHPLFSPLKKVGHTLPRAQGCWPIFQGQSCLKSWARWRRSMWKGSLVISKRFVEGFLTNSQWVVGRWCMFPDFWRMAFIAHGI